MSAPMILAESEVERIIRLSRNAEFARAYLEKGIRVPTFPEILAEYSGVTDASALREKLCIRLQGMIGEPNAASIRRKVSVWFTGKTAPENRGQLVRIVFALDMSDEQAQNFLACAGGGCLHQRNPIELAYLYALRSRLNYNEACHLIERIRHIAIGGQGKTEVLENEFTKIRGEDEFVDFIRQQRMNLGELHNTAYEYFQEYMEVLTKPPDSFPHLPERAYSVREIVQMYLKPPAGSSSVLGKTLRAHWPDEKTLSQIANRRQDVPRKVLILLFLITDGAENSLYVNDAAVSDDARVLFDDRYRRVNQMLDDCGYSQLDPRNVFDWLMLYCMYDHGELNGNERLQAVLRETEENDALGGNVT